MTYVFIFGALATSVLINNVGLELGSEQAKENQWRTTTPAFAFFNIDRSK